MKVCRTEGRLLVKCLKAEVVCCEPTNHSDKRKFLVQVVERVIKKLVKKN